MLRLIMQTSTKRRDQKIEKQKDETKENHDAKDFSSTTDENEDGQSSNTHNDQDIDISFKSDTDVKLTQLRLRKKTGMNTSKKSTDEAIDKMEGAKIRCWIKTHKRMSNATK